MYWPGNMVRCQKSNMSHWSSNLTEGDTLSLGFIPTNIMHHAFGDAHYWTRYTFLWLRYMLCQVMVCPIGCDTCCLLCLVSFEQIKPVLVHWKLYLRRAECRLVVVRGISNLFFHSDCFLGDSDWSLNVARDFGQLLECQWMRSLYKTSTYHKCHSKNTNRDQLKTTRPWRLQWAIAPKRIFAWKGEDEQ